MLTSYLSHIVAMRPPLIGTYFFVCVYFKEGRKVRSIEKNMSSNNNNSSHNNNPKDFLFRSNSNNDNHKSSTDDSNSSSEDESIVLKINQKFAKDYEKKKRAEELTKHEKRGLKYALSSKEDVSGM